MTRKQKDAWLKERREALREYLAEAYGDDVVMLDGPEFDGGIVGVTTGNRLVYSYEKLVQSLHWANGWSVEDAVDWIEFNTIRALPYIDDAPVVVYDLDPDEFAPAKKKTARRLTSKAGI